MEPNKQIDYGTLEWFDCKNNFPPMSIDLYVDSEHGYGIGRLGRRVKNKSIIWTVHLDSGEVYMVYAFYKVKRWAYMPKDEKTNTKLKHELMLNKERFWVPCYLKSEADKVIEDLEESHKMEVEQLLMEIVKLKEERRWRKFSEEKPKDKQLVLVYGDNWFEIAIYHDNGLIDFGDDIHFSNITETPYWMPPPSAPKEER